MDQDRRVGEGSRRMMMVAVGLAAAALAIVLVAVIVVATRGEPAASAGIVGSAAAPTEKAPALVEQHVAAADVVDLDRMSAVETDHGGLRVTDAALAQRLGLKPDDVIVSISGREVTRVFDIHEVVFNTSMMNVTTLYVELERDHTLVRWKLDGDLRTARYSGSTLGTFGGYSSISPPPPPPASDPLLDTIARVDDTHTTIPKATVDALLADPSKFMRSLRMVPAVKDGKAAGLKLYAIRPSSVFARLGFANGDTIETVNGKDVSDAAKALDVFSKLSGATRVEVALTRRGHPMTLTITVN